MHAMFKSALVALVAATFVAAQTTFVITVGGKETSGDPTTTFQPQRVDAVVGDTVIFNFTQGNHTATQSTFAAPCIPAHDSNITINGFNSGPRDAGNGTAITILSVPILKENVADPFWFYDATPGACGQGAVGVINSNENGNETLAGFQRNAIRLNGTSTSSSSFTPTATSTHSSTATAPSSSSGAGQLQAFGRMDFLVAPLAFIAMGFALL